jgi:hypothetical protein
LPGKGSEQSGFSGCFNLDTSTTRSVTRRLRQIKRIFPPPIVCNNPRHLIRSKYCSPPLAYSYDIPKLKMFKVIVVLTVFASTNAVASCGISVSEVEKMKGLSVGEAQVLVTENFPDCSLIVNYVDSGAQSVSRRPPIRQAQQWYGGAIIVNAIREPAMISDQSPVLSSDRISEGIIHTCGKSGAQCTVLVPFRNGDQFFGGHYQPENADRTLFEFMKRVAMKDGRLLLWEAGSSMLKEIPMVKYDKRLSEALGAHVSSVSAVRQVIAWHNNGLVPNSGEGKLYSCVSMGFIKISRVPDTCKSSSI